MGNTKNIYFVLTYTGTILAKIVKLYTRKKYSHVSIALDDSLKNMYSFGRLNPYNPFIGGFVVESKDRGTFKRFKNTKTVVFSYEISEEQYERIKREIDSFIINRKRYKFNVLGLFLVMFNIKLNRKNCFYCAEFVKYLVEKDGIITDLPDIVKPNDFKELSNMKLVYKGKLNSYAIT